ncbi:MAG: biotin carboxylase N-terminal domain-containing protein [Acidimicrobiia bacterium]
MIVHPIHRLLVANRAEIASRVIRSARAMGIESVAVYSDADAGLPFVRDADIAVRLPGVAAADTYLRGDLLVEAARRTRADAVHPGYGFLSERADFARACADAGLVFVGPSPDAIDRMGSKIAAKELMAAAGVPVLPGASVTPGDSVDDLARAGASVGYPLLVKAAFGGGGRGMRAVTAPEELADAVASATREAVAAFGDGTVFLERYVTSPRHVEIQVFGDHHGTVVTLFERECSIQRRHQKIIEEAPSPAVDAALRAAMSDAAVRAARAIGYVSAGTVEFVLGPDGRFFFLEVNTRLQVEHPVTEMVTGLDLVALQLWVAQGEPLPAEARTATMRGHAVEARLYAEDVAAGFLPVSGPLHRCAVPTAVDGVRVDAGYEDGSAVSPYYDALLAKVVAWGPTRAEAVGRCAAALRAARVHGVVTNRDLLVGILTHPEFLAGATDTAFLDRNPPAALMVADEDDLVVCAAIAATLAGGAAARAASPVPTGIPRGWRNVGPASQPVTMRTGTRAVAVDASADLGPGHVTVDGESEPAVVHACTADHVDLEVRGVRAAYAVHRVGERVYVDCPTGSVVLDEDPRFPQPVADETPGSLVAPMPGAVVAVAADPGQVVAAGTTLVTLEAMKMEHAVRAPAAGVVAEVRVAVGDQVETGDVLVVIEVEVVTDGEVETDGEPEADPGGGA